MTDQKGDLYGLLGLSWRERANYSSRDISRAYRRSALIHHPDKSKNVEATSRFGEIFDAYEVLLDDKLRAEYDTRLKAREEREERWGKEDVGRRKLREDLKKRENERGGLERTKGREERLRREIVRLRKEMGERNRKERTVMLEKVGKMERDMKQGRDETIPGLAEFRFGAGGTFEHYEKSVLEKLNQKIEELEGNVQ